MELEKLKTKEDQENQENLDEEEPLNDPIDPKGKESIIKGFNFYATKKTIAQGLLDLALLTTNAMQLKHIIMIGELHPFHKLLLTGIIISLMLQVILGLLLLVLGARDIEKHRVNRLNNTVALLIFIITIINVVLSVFNDETLSLKYRDCLQRVLTISGHGISHNGTDIGITFNNSTQ